MWWLDPSERRYVGNQPWPDHILEEKSVNWIRLGL